MKCIGACLAPGHLMNQIVKYYQQNTVNPAGGPLREKTINQTVISIEVYLRTVITLV